MLSHTYFNYYYDIKAVKIPKLISRHAKQTPQGRANQKSSGQTLFLPLKKPCMCLY